MTRFSLRDAALGLCLGLMGSVSVGAFMAKERTAGVPPDGLVPTEQLMAVERRLANLESRPPVALVTRVASVSAGAGSVEPSQLDKAGVEFYSERPEVDIELQRELERDASQALEQIVREQARDAAWAEATEAAAMTEAANLAGVDMRVRCRTSLCQVNVEYGDGAVVDTNMRARMSMTLFANAQALTFFDRDQNGRTVGERIFVARTGYSLPDVGLL